MERLIITLILLMAFNSVYCENRPKESKVCKLVEYFNEKDDNIEISEYRNELLFEIIQGKDVDCLLKVASSDTILQKKICLELQNPVDDTIDLKTCRTVLGKFEAVYAFVRTWVESIDIAYGKFEFLPSGPSGSSQQ